MKSGFSLEKLELRAKVAELAAKITWLRIPEACEYAAIGQSKMWELIEEGEMPSSKNEGAVVIHRADIDAYWNARRRSKVGLVYHVDQSSPASPVPQKICA